MQEKKDRSQYSFRRKQVIIHLTNLFSTYSHGSHCARANDAVVMRNAILRNHLKF